MYSCLIMFLTVYHLCFVFVLVGCSLPVADSYKSNSRLSSRRVNGLDMNIHAKAYAACRSNRREFGYNWTWWDDITGVCERHCQYRLSGLIYDNGSVIIPRVRYPFAHDVIASCNKNSSLVKDKCNAVDQIYYCVKDGLHNKIINVMNQHARTCSREQEDENIYTYNGFHSFLPGFFRHIDSLGSIDSSTIRNSCNFLCVLRKMGIVNGTNYPEYRKVEKHIPLKGMHVVRYGAIYRDCKSIYGDQKECDRDMLFFCCFLDKAIDAFNVLYTKMTKYPGFINANIDLYNIVSARAQGKVYIEWRSQ